MESTKKVLSISKRGPAFCSKVSGTTHKLKAIRKEVDANMYKLRAHIATQLDDIDQVITAVSYDHDELVNYWTYIARTNAGDARKEAIEWLAYNQ